MGLVWDVLVSWFPLIAAHSTKLFRPLQQSALPAFPFFRRCRAITVTVDDLASQTGCLALLRFAVCGIDGLLRAHAFYMAAFIVPALKGALARVMNTRCALDHHPIDMGPHAAAG
jgi:hypothetical protein